MIELTGEHFPILTPLLADLGPSVLLRAVLEGFNPGWVFADDPSAPASALIGLPCGCFFGLGRPPRPEDLPALAATLRDGLVARSLAAGNSGFLFAFGSAEWPACLPDLLPGRTPLRIFRRAFDFSPSLFTSLEPLLDPLPPGLHLERIDARALAAFPDLRREVSGSWRTEQDFLRDGLGVFIAVGGELLSYCLSPFACRDALEISVATAPGFRRKGLARQVAAAFLRFCLDAGRRPNWECFWDNLPSVSLALSLGFSADQDRPVYYWEESPPSVGRLPAG